MESHFKTGDEVLVYHNDILYDAKIVMAKLRDNVWRYHVHYVGWSKSHDEWVGEARVRVKNKESLDVQRQLRQNAAAGVPDRSRGAPPLKTRKRKIGGVLKVQIAIPRALRQQLKSHRELLKSKQLTKLPRSPNVDGILKMYQEQTKNSQAVILNGLRQLFNRALEPLLLCREERSQYEKMMSLDSTLIPSTVYGAEHLLRLFVNLPELLKYNDETEAQLCSMESELDKILRFMERFF